MLITSQISLMRSVGIFGFAALLAVGSASAQSAFAHKDSTSAAVAATPAETYSSSAAANEEALPSAPAPAPSAAGGQGGYQSHSFWSHITGEVGGGFNGPTSSSSSYITWGGQFGLGAGYRFNPYFSTLVDYQLIIDKLPGKLIAETGANGGYAHMWSFTLNPVLDLFPKSTNDVYVTGGGGFYRKVTNFTNPTLGYYCDYFYCYPGYTNQVVGHFSSNQGGWSIGGGYQYHMGGMYGDGRMKLFAEVRYLDVMTPASAISPNGLGVAAVGAGTKLIPVTFGLRW